MALKSNYNESRTNRELHLIHEAEYMQLLEDLKTDCDVFLRDAREQPEGHELGFYNNREGFLRDSIAAYIFRDGLLVWFDERGHSAENRELIRDVKKRSRGFTVIGIAGMNYATKVEAYGYNVISMQGDRFILDLATSFMKHGQGRVMRAKRIN